MANRYWLVSIFTFTSDIMLTTSTSLTGGENELTWNPHPTEYTPYSDARTQGTGDLTGLGYANFKWTSGDGYLTAEQWAYLMNFFTGSEPSVSVYVKTRVDECETNFLGEYEYSYRWFQAKMHRPTAEFGPDFRLRNVEIVFSHATEVG
jgi:hypothetical protein